MVTLDPDLTVNGTGSTATVSTHGAHVTGWAPDGAEPVLWMSSTTRREPGAPIRGGVPICFPWFGPGVSGDRSPSHGFARVLPWRVVDAEDTAGSSGIVLELGSPDLSDEDRAAVGGEFTARYSVDCGEDLLLTLTVTNVGETPFTFEEALHTYLRVGDVRQVQIEGLEDTVYADKTQGGAEHEQQGELTLTEETDRVYRSGGKVTVVDPVLGRRLVVTKKDSASTIVWNPFPDKAATLSDIGDGEWQTLLCVEGGNVLDETIGLAPGESHSMSYRLSVEPL